jgi:hypothetical protein
VALALAAGQVRDGRDATPGAGLAATRAMGREADVVTTSGVTAPLRAMHRGQVSSTREEGVSLVRRPHRAQYRLGIRISGDGTRSWHVTSTKRKQSTSFFELLEAKGASGGTGAGQPQAASSPASQVMARPHNVA